MLKDLVAFLQQDHVQPYYIGLCMATMIVPMLWLALWFHRRIGNSEGGRRLMRDHGAVAPTRSRSPIAAGRQIGHAAGLFRGIQSGAYGEEVKATYRVVWIVVALWLAVNALVWGLPLYGLSLYGPQSADFHQIDTKDTFKNVPHQSW